MDDRSASPQGNALALQDTDIAVPLVKSYLNRRAFSKIWHHFYNYCCFCFKKNLAYFW